MGQFFKLAPDGRTPVPCENHLEWYGSHLTGIFTSGVRGQVAHTDLGVTIVHTSFWGGPTAPSGKVALFKTECYLGPYAGRIYATSTWEDALQLHEQICGLWASGPSSKNGANVRVS